MTWTPEPDDAGRLFQTYVAVIKRMSDGVIREYACEHPWHSSSWFWWSEGNGSCDCNRELDFLRAGDENDDVDPQCGDERYQVLEFKFPDGTSLPFDPAASRS